MPRIQPLARPSPTQSNNNLNFNLNVFPFGLGSSTKHAARLKHWRAFVPNDAEYVRYNINFNLTGQAQTPPEALQSYSTTATDPSQIDLVSLCVSSDFRVLFDSKGMLTFFRHIQGYRTLTLLCPETDLPAIREALRANAAELEQGKAVEGGSGKTVPAIHFVSESYFVKRYKDRLDCPYPKACQQFMKLFIFDLPFLLDNVLVVDSDTAWGKDITFVHGDGRVSYINECERKECYPHDPVQVVNTLFNPNNAVFTKHEAEIASRDKDGLRRRDLDCRFDRFCGNQNSSGCRHILHHMLLQRDVMTALHRDVNELWGGRSLWESFMMCWATRPCQGRVSEYEMYYSYVSCKFPERVKDERFEFRNAAGDCSEKEMERCRAKGVLLKGCHDHRKDDPEMGMC